MFPASFNLADLDGSNGFVIRGIDAYDYSGRSVSNAGDVNGDGIDDLIIGARDAGSREVFGYPGETQGESYVVFGSNDGFTAELELANLNGNNGFLIRGIDDLDNLGSSVSNAGDVNGDGIDDIIIGASGAEAEGEDIYGEKNRGESYVIFGSRERFTAEFALTSLDGNNGFIVRGIDPGDFLGGSVSNAGDVNGDGIDDIIVGARGAEVGAISSFSAGREGESYVIFGSREGFTAELDLATLDGNNGFVIRGINEDDVSGSSVSNAGDVNGDGIGDIIIGANGAEVGAISDYLVGREGESYVVFGSSEGFVAELDLATLDGNNGFVLRGIDENDNSGRSLSNAGDLNGDGIDDIIIGAREAENDKISQGESYVVFGSSEGFAAELDLATLNGSNGFVFRGIDENDGSGSSVSNAGDVNGDGIEDLIIGTYRAEADTRLQGESYVVFGSSAGFPAEFDLATLDGSNGFVLRGINEADFSGSSVSNAGDINGDGIDDFAIGAPFAEPGEEVDFYDYTYSGRQGETYVIFGVAEDDSDIIAGTENDDLLTGTNRGDRISGLGGNDTIRANSGNDRLDGDGGNDFLNGNRGNDTLFGGVGDDRLFGNLDNDLLEGGAGSDRVVGGDGDDILVGVDLVATDSEFGRGEIDVLVGDRQNGGRDIFIVGDEVRPFYDDNNPSTTGTNDLARIRGFDANEDLIQLHGTPNLYRLTFDTNNTQTTNAHLIYQPESAETGELIATIFDVNEDLSLDDATFSFV